MNSSLQPQKSGQSSLKTLFLIAIFFLAGMALSALYFHAKFQPKPVADLDSAAALSDSTTKVLQKLGSPVEIRYYSILDTSTVPANVQAFSKHVDKLLARYQQESGDKIKVTRYTTTNSTAAQAVKDGMNPFNLDKGDASYLGLTVVNGGKTETIPYLAPEWQQAVESDLTRAVARVSSASTTGSLTPSVPATAATVDSVKQIIPNPDSVSVEEGTQRLREAALAEFKQAAEESQAKQDLLQKQYLDAQSDSDKQRLLQEIQASQGEQTQKIKDIAAKSKAQIDAFTQTKSGAH